MIYGMNLGIGFTLFAASEEIMNACVKNDFLVKKKVIEDEHIDDIL